MYALLKIEILETSNVHKSRDIAWNFLKLPLYTMSQPVLRMKKNWIRLRCSSKNDEQVKEIFWITLHPFFLKQNFKHDKSLVAFYVKTLIPFTNWRYVCLALTSNTVSTNITHFQLHPRHSHPRLNSTSKLLDHGLGSSVTKLWRPEQTAYHFPSSIYKVSYSFSLF